MKKLLAFLLACGLVVCVAGCTSGSTDIPTTAPITTESVTDATEPTEPPIDTEALKETLDPIVEQNNFTGIVSLTRNGEVIYQSVSGNNELGDPLTIESPMYIGSVSKQFCAAAILILRDQDKLSVDDKLEKYFPEYELGKDITIKNLLTMRSGIPNFTNHFSEIEFKEDGITDLKKWAFSQPLRFAPNTGWEYSNTNFVLLGLIVEQVSGQSYEQFVRQNIFEPLGMTHSGFITEVPENPSWGLTYDTMGVEENVPEIVKGAGDITSTAADMDTWMTGLSTGKVISMDSYREMTTNYSADFATNYGYGIMGMYGGFAHTGNIGTYNALEYFDPETGYKLFFVSNQNTPRLEKMAREIVNNLPTE